MFLGLAKGKELATEEVARRAVCATESKGRRGEEILASHNTDQFQSKKSKRVLIICLAQEKCSV